MFPGFQLRRLTIRTPAQTVNGAATGNGRQPGERLASLGRITRGALPNLDHDLLQHIIDFSFVEHDGADERFETLPITDKKFGKGLFLSVCNSRDERFIASPCGSGAVQSRFYHESEPEKWLLRGGM